MSELDRGALGGVACEVTSREGMERERGDEENFWCQHALSDLRSRDTRPEPITGRVLSVKYEHMTQANAPSV